MINEHHFALLRSLQIGGCTCMTKTPELHYHAEDCKSRLAAEIERVLRHGVSALDGPWVEWVEPLGDGNEPVYMRATAKDIAAVRRRIEPRYTSDEQAIDDFMVIHFAKFVKDAQ